MGECSGHSLPGYDAWKLSTPPYYDDPCTECDDADECEYDHEYTECQRDIEGEWADAAHDWEMEG